MFQSKKKKIGGKFLVPQNTPQEVKKGPREEVLEQLKLKKTQLKQLNQPNTRGGKMVRRALLGLGTKMHASKALHRNTEPGHVHVPCCTL